MSDAKDVTKDRLLDEVRLVIADAEELLRATAGQTGEKLADIRARTQDHLAGAKLKLAEVEGALIATAKQAGQAADEYVHREPWNAVGIAAGVGFVIGLLIGRR